MSFLRHVSPPWLLVLLCKFEVGRFLLNSCKHIQFDAEGNGNIQSCRNKQIPLFYECLLKHLHVSSRLIVRSYCSDNLNCWWWWQITLQRLCMHCLLQTLSSKFNKILSTQQCASPLVWTVVWASLGSMCFQSPVLRCGTTRMISLIAINVHCICEQRRKFATCKIFKASPIRCGEAI